MSETEDLTQYHYFLKRDSTGLRIGIVDNEGSILGSGIVITVHYTKLPNEFLDLNSSFPIPDGYHLQFIKGVVYEIGLTYGKELLRFRSDYNNAKKEFNSQTVHQTQLPVVLSPLDMRYEE